MAAFPEYEEHDAVGLAELIGAGQVSAEEVVGAAIDRIELANPTLNAVITKTYDRALRRVAGGVPEGPLGGVPFLLKDLSSEWAGVPSTDGSRSMRWYVPGFTSTLVQRYEAAGLVILGKTNVPEFGLAPVTEPELHGITANPWDPERTAGGSSGGSAAAVAAGMVPAAHGSDGGGSIRIPASQCGLFGLKPTRGRLPVGPVVGEGWFGMSSAHVVSRSVRDSAVLLDLTAGPEPGDPYAAPPVERPFASEVGADPGRLRIGVVSGGIFHDDIHPECRRAVGDAADLLDELGHRVEGVDLPLAPEEWSSAFLTLVAASTVLGIAFGAETLGKSKPDPEDYELATWVLGLVGRKLSAADVAEALFTIRSAGRVMGRVMERLDVVMTSTLAGPPFPHGELQPTELERRVLEGLRMAPAKPALMAAFQRLSEKVLRAIPNTPLFNMTGQPAMSVPLHWTPGGLPVGVQLAGRFGGEPTLLRLAGQIEQARPWFERRPRVTTGRLIRP